jgi:assimilatory nitrate reductase catalytic subunit
VLFRSLAASASGAHWSDLAKALLPERGALAEMLDEGQGRYRAAVIEDGRLQACLFLAKSPQALPGWEWLKQQLAAPALTESARRALLSGRAPDAGADQGPVVCACFGVGRNQISSAVACGRAKSAEEIGTLLKAGTNCGSCLPEVRRLVAEAAMSAPGVPQ